MGMRGVIQSVGEFVMEAVAPLSTSNGFELVSNVAEWACLEVEEVAVRMVVIPMHASRMVRVEKCFRLYVLMLL